MTLFSRFASPRLTDLFNNHLGIFEAFYQLIFICSDRLDRCDFEPRDRQRLKQRCEPSDWFRPRIVSLTNSVFQAVNPGNTGLDHGDIPTGVKAPSLTLAMVVGGAILVTLRAPEPPKWLVGQFQCDLHLLDLEADLLNAPGSGQAKQLFIELFVLQNRKFS